MNRQQTRGVILLLVIIVALQFAFRNCEFRHTFTPVDTALGYREMDSLRALATALKKDTIYPFNPNFITDYKGFKLGLTLEQIDRLQAFRAQNRYVNSAREFQQVTGVSDSLLAKIAPSFKFPDWVNNRKTTAYNYEYAFTYIDQVAEVYGLDKEVYQRVAERFEVQTAPVIEKKNINALNMYELSKIPYVKYGEGKKIVGLRSELGAIKSFDDLLQIEGFDKERIARLQLYLYIE